MRFNNTTSSPWLTVPFEILPVPTWKYKLGENKALIKQLAIPCNENTNSVVIGYTYSAPKDAPPITLTLKPLMAFRDFRNLSSESEWSQNKNNNTLTLEHKDKNSDEINHEYLAWNRRDAEYKDDS